MLPRYQAGGEGGSVMETTAGQWQPTACILRSVNCGIEVRVGGDGRSFERVRGDKAHPGSRGYTCEKAVRLDHYQNGTHRLTSPVRRRADGSFEEVDCDTAIAEVAERLAAVAAEHGGDKILFYGGGVQGNHLGGGYAAAPRTVLGSSTRPMQTTSRTRRDDPAA